MWINTKKPDINWISNPRRNGDEWCTYTKRFSLEKPIKSAVVRFQTDSTCGVYVNGEFIISGTGRLPERVNCHEITSKFVLGDNYINIVIGSTYYQQKGYEMKEQRGYWLNEVALEICFEFEDGEKKILSTDSTWTADIDGTCVPAVETMRVTDAEYDTMWKYAAPWVEEESHRPYISPEVVKVAGEEYASYAAISPAEYVYPASVAKTNMIQSNDGYIANCAIEETPYIIYDFGRLAVGYTDIQYCTQKDICVTMHFDFSERISDFDFDPQWEWSEVVKRLDIRQLLKADERSAFNLRRRAFRFVKIEFEKDNSLCIKNIRVKPCMYPSPKRGWFKSSDELLNKAWEVGKYTLHVNKQQEYESCPRNEMAFFSGDGYIDALVDLYVFGEDKLMESSLSLKHSEACGGIAYTSKFLKYRHQWDYYAWRIISVHLHYKITGDMDFLRDFYEETELSLLWQLERLGKNKLIFQPPCYYSTYTFTLGQVDWACSPARLGEKPYLNALLYKSLIAMAELDEAMGYSEKSSARLSLAEEIKNAVNDVLWCEEKNMYKDVFDDYTSQDGNVIPVLFGIADKERAKTALSTIKQNLWSPYGASILDEYIPHTRGGNTTVSPLMCAYEAEARFINGLPDEAIELIRNCWGNMLNKGAGTFWEFSPNNDYERWDAVSHAWSSGCTYLLSAYVLGIRMTKPNFESIIFQPQICDLSHFSGVVPSNGGLIAASYKKQEINGKIINVFELALPEKTQVEYILPENSKINIIRY